MSAEVLDSFKQHIIKPGDPIGKPKVRRIFVVLLILGAITGVELAFAFYNYYANAGWEKPLKYLYIILTLLKAYYIIFDYMHLGHEKKSFKFTLGALVIILTYFVWLMMTEGYYQGDIHFDLPKFMMTTPEAPAH